MASAIKIHGLNSPRLALSTPKQPAPARTAWTDIFSDYAVRHMAAGGTMSLKIALQELARQNDSQNTEQDKRGQ